MIRGLYTGASAMVMNQHRMDSIANNLANVDTTAYKSEEALAKSFPALLIRRTREDGLGHVPMGSFDLAPFVGKLGLGVEFHENYVRFGQGAAKRTSNPLDLMIDDRGNERPAFFVVMTEKGETLTRNGAFSLNKNGHIVNAKGYPLMGEKGLLQIHKHNFLIRENGEIWINAIFGNDPEAGVGEKNNDWSEAVVLDKIKIRTVEYPRELKKQGESLYVTNSASGPMARFEDLGTEMQAHIFQGFLESSNVNLVRQMVDMIAVQRSYEASQRSLSSHDQLLGKLINEVIR